MTQLEFHDEPYDGPIAQQLIAEVQQEYVARYGGPDTTPVEPGEFGPPDGRFLVGYLDGEPVAMGGLRRHHDDGPNHVEIKRMYVVPRARGRGLSREMLAALEAAALELGAKRVVLETGERQPEALQLYRTSGYTEIDGYGHYADAELSHSFEKLI